MANGYSGGAGVFAPGGVAPTPTICNAYTPHHAVIGDGPLYVSPDCTTVLTDCQMNALVSEILAAVDLLGYPYNSTRVDNLGQALKDRLDVLMAGELGDLVRRSGDTMTGPLRVVCPPANDNEATCKSYVDQTAQAAADACCAHMQGQLDGVTANLQTQINNRVRRDGDQMTGPLILSGDPTVDAQAATKAYVDARSGGVIISDQRPQNQPPAQLWWDSVSGRLFINYDDGTSTQFVQACSSCDAGGATGDFLPLSGGTLTGMLMINTGAPSTVSLVTSGSMSVAGDTQLTGNVNIGGHVYVDTTATINGALTLGGNATQPLQAVPLRQLQDYLPLTGGTLTGALLLHDSPTVTSPALQAATKQYVDTMVASGGTFVDAPADGELYGRQDNGWVPISISTDGGVW